MVHYRAVAIDGHQVFCDPFFLPAGAEAFRRDNSHAEVRLYDTGHFALETHVAEIAAAIESFLGGSAPAQTEAPVTPQDR